LFDIKARQNAAMIDVNSSSISIGGISAGGHLACVLQHMARDANIELKLLIATVPVSADHDLYQRPEDSPWPSFTEFSEAPTLNWERMRYFSKLVFDTEETPTAREVLPVWWISPLRAPNFEGLCDTLLLTAECDPLRDEGEAYGVKLVKAGNRVTFQRYVLHSCSQAISLNNMIQLSFKLTARPSPTRYLKVPHPFMHMFDTVPQASQWQSHVVQALKVAHGL
jgi:acetyl esterase/lipase